MVENIKREDAEKLTIYPKIQFYAHNNYLTAGTHTRMIRDNEEYLAYVRTEHNFPVTTSSIELNINVSDINEFLEALKDTVSKVGTYGKVIDSENIKFYKLI